MKSAPDIRTPQRGPQIPPTVLALASPEAETPVHAYAEVTRLVERLHRRYLDVVRFELNRLKREDINPVQALLLMNIQSADLSMRDLVERGYYIGSNVTYNVRQLAASGYLEQQRSERDRRSVKLRLTEKGTSLCAHLVRLESGHAARLNDHEVEGGIVVAREALRALERVWTEHIQYGRE
ncbi:MAG: MarR family transcriptional regulator [Alphaproteobacteria bacterium]|nr:MarR family transcriptional regulator [Alphaproteobacteria bacterium]